MPLDLSPFVLLVWLIALGDLGLYLSPVILFGWASWRYRGTVRGRLAFVALWMLVGIYSAMIRDARADDAKRQAWCDQVSVSRTCSDAN